jgi:hypothetical protein
MKTTIDREKHHRLTRSLDVITTGQLSPISSSAYSPIMIGSLHENMNTQSGGFETDRRSHTSVRKNKNHFSFKYEDGYNSSATIQLTLEIVLD